MQNMRDTETKYLKLDLCKIKIKDIKIINTSIEHR